MNASEVIDRLGGTYAVARLCEVNPPSVSGWKQLNRIPRARLMYLRLIRPEAFVDDEKKATINPVSKACAILGGQRVLADRLGVTPPFVNQWLSGYRRVPAERCPDIERLTGGAVRCEDLRPDVDWGVLRTGAPQPESQESNAA